MTTHDFLVDELLRRLCQVTAEWFDADGVGVMRTDADAVNRFLYASGEPLTGLEVLQEALQQGPCREAVDTGRVVTAGGGDQARWPVSRRPPPPRWMRWWRCRC